MPQAIAIFLITVISPFLISAGLTSVAAITAISVGIQIAVTVGIGFGLNYLSGLLTPQAKPQDRQSIYRQAAMARFRLYGRGKVGGVLMFLSVKSGVLYRVIAQGNGEIDAVEEHWIDSRVVELIVGGDFDGTVSTDPYGSGNTVTIRYRLGLDEQEAYSELTTNFPTLWSADHKGNGLPHAMISAKQVKPEKITKYYPRGEPLYRQVQRGAKLYNPLIATHNPNDKLTWEWSENAALIIMDYMTHPDGLGLARSFVETPMAARLWSDAIQAAAVPVPLKAGGSEDRWRIWNSYTFDERPADVLMRFLNCCDGVMVPTPDGGIGIKLGAWEVPVVTITGEAVVGYDIAHGRDILTTANSVHAQYTSPFHDYQGVDADPWTDDADITARGEYKRETQFYCAPSHGQCRRLMKLMARRGNPNWTGTITCNLRALPAIGERFVNIEIPELGIAEPFEIVNAQWQLAEDSILKGIVLTVISSDAAAYAWDAVLEEGTSPAIPDDLIFDNALPLPEDFTVTIESRSTGAVAVLRWTALVDEFLQVQARGKKTAELEWLVIPVQTDAVQAETVPLEDGEEYEFQIRTVSVTGRVSEWTPSILATVTVDTVAPGIVTNVSAVGGVGLVDLSFKSPNSANFNRANLYRDTVNVIPISPFTAVFGAPNATLTYQDSGLAAGTYYYWIKAANVSNVESAAVATGAVTVT